MGGVVFESEKHPFLLPADFHEGITPRPFTVEVRMEKPAGLHGSRLRPISGEKVKLGLRTRKWTDPPPGALTWK